MKKDFEYFKEKVAKEKGYINYNCILLYHSWFIHKEILDEAAELYHKEGIEQGILKAESTDNKLLQGEFNRGWNESIKLSAERSSMYVEYSNGISSEGIKESILKGLRK